MDLINNAKEESNKRTIENYAKAIQTAIVSERITGSKITTLKEMDLVISKYYDGNIQCDYEKSKLYSDGTVYLEGCKIGNDQKTYTYGKIVPICKATNQDKKGSTAAGTEYMCEVSPGVKYRFFVLPNQEEADEKVNLIMYANINEFGEAVDGNQKNGFGNIMWYNEDNNQKGPVTAMNYLAEITKNWTNLTPLTESYDDKIDNSGEYGYDKINFEEGKIYAKDETSTSITISNGTSDNIMLRARLPYASEIKDYDNDETNQYLYNYLSKNDANVPVVGIKSIYGYWTISSEARFSDRVRIVYCSGVVTTVYPNNERAYGVRPVITVSIDELA